eukprot:UN07536
MSSFYLKILEPDKDTYDVLLEACAELQLSEKSVELIEEMLQRNLEVSDTNYCHAVRSFSNWENCEIFSKRFTTSEKCTPRL